MSEEFQARDPGRTAEAVTVIDVDDDWAVLCGSTTDGRPTMRSDSITRLGQYEGREAARGEVASL